ncbi:hypothetical protein GCM10027155_14570 [Acinetobacter apis]|uniref:Uncharacterized conserved protein, DUF697 family n=1 Tax=Acinetobacter apis TaxID=1229165 RepID=A0A217EH13_9GAMM|nr:hypothetical protein [Acinetobacter apis]SNQ29799.1 Uncharacterized conserved protein, DUF697 family [Acinetobacter apis]
MKIENVPSSIDPQIDLERAKRECLELTKKRAYISAGAAIVPIPFFDVVIDVGILTALIPEINQKLGLSKDYTTVFNPQTKEVHWDELKKRGIEFSGLMVARTGVKKSINGFVSRMLTKQVTKFVPLGGQIIAASLGYIVFKKIAESHIEDSYNLAKKIQNEQRERDAAAQNQNQIPHQA